MARLTSGLSVPPATCRRLYITRSEIGRKADYGDPVSWKLLAIAPTVHVPRVCADEINRTSPRFGPIYNQAAAAEAAGLDQLCGAG
jgi:hypothetical protein